MNWTRTVQALPGPLYFNSYVRTRIYHLKQPTVYGPEVVVKQVSCDTEAQAQTAENEARTAKEHPHPHIFECLGWTREPDPAGGFFVYIFSAPMPMSLMEDVERRARQALYYREEELWSFYLQLLDALCHLQTLGIAHRDIKPHNILLNPADNHLRICDFGFAKLIHPQAPLEGSLLFTLAYCSPAIRSARLKTGMNKVQHDVYKSDVFSLGMTFVHLSLLLLPEPFTELPNLQVYIEQELRKITRFSEKWVDQLRLMLTVEEARRPTFLELRTPVLYADDEVLPPLQDEAEVEEPLSLTVKCGLQYVRVSQQAVDEVPCMVSLKAKDQDPEMREYGLDLMCVIDRSGSMKGRKMALVQRSLVGLIGRLGDRDRLAIVAFNDKAERKCPLIRCTDEGKARLQTLIETIQGGGHTCIARGFLMGLEVLKRRQSLNQAVSLLLFSDGKNTSGGDPTAPCLSTLQQCSLGKFSVYTFGYGETLDARLLEALAEQGKGQFQHITREAQIGQVFAYTLGNATSVVARNVQVSISLLADCKVPCDITKLYSKDCSNVFALPDVHANEQKELVFLLKPRYLPLPRNLSDPVVQITLTYTDNEGVETTTNANMNVKFFTWDGHPAGGQDAVVYRHWYRVRGADYLREARELASQQRFAEANALLSNGTEALQASGYVAVPLVQAVLRDITQAKELVQSNTTWERGGDAHFASISYAHFSQSATALTSQYASRQQNAQLPAILEQTESDSSR